MKPEEILNKMVEGISQVLDGTYYKQEATKATYTYLDGDEVIVRLLSEEDLCK